MYVLDTDILTLLLQGHSRVSEKWARSNEEVVVTVITQIEVLSGRFASVTKAENGEKLLLAYERLVQSERDLRKFVILGVDAAVAAEFDRLCAIKKLRKCGRRDLLIGAITMANRATVVTRNRADFDRIPGLRVENWAD